MAVEKPRMGGYPLGGGLLPAARSDQLAAEAGACSDEIDAPLSSLPGLTRQSILFVKTLCEIDGPPGQARG